MRINENTWQWECIQIYRKIIKTFQMSSECQTAEPYIVNVFVGEDFKSLCSWGIGKKIKDNLSLFIHSKSTHLILLNSKNSACTSLSNRALYSYLENQILTLYQVSYTIDGSIEVDNMALISSALWSSCMLGLHITRCQTSGPQWFCYQLLAL